MKKVVIFFIVLFILSIIACSGTSTPAEHAPVPTFDESEVKIPTEKPEPKNYEFGPGRYSVKKDDKNHIQPGTYDIKCVSGSGNVSTEGGEWNHFVNLIMATKTDDLYISEYKNAMLDDGMTLQVENVTIKLIGK